MVCRPMRDAEGRPIGIVCGPKTPQRRCSEPGCTKPSTVLCDWPVEGVHRPEKTCDRKLCQEHAHRVGRDTDYCPQHAAEVL